MYPTVNALMGTWRLLKAQTLEAVDATDHVRQFLERVSLERCFDPALWGDLNFFAKVKPQGDVLPVRAEYDTSVCSLNIGVNPLVSDIPLWYAGPDLVASKLPTGRPPEVLQAFRLVPQGTQAGLQTVRLAGAVPVDPAQKDFFRRVIETRKGLVDTKPPTQRTKRLDRFLKVLANSGSYGIYAEMNRIELPKRKKVKLSVYGLDGRVTHRTRTPEEPGIYCFPPVAALITAGSRLMLSILERCLSELGGTYAFCDTDSMAIVASRAGGLVACKGGPYRLAGGQEAVRALSWRSVSRIRERFVRLNPYDRSVVPGSILELEEENFDEASGEQIQLYVYVISAKRYALFTSGSEQWNQD